MPRIAHWAAFALTVLATLYSARLLFDVSSPLGVYLWVCVPILLAAIPFRWPRRLWLAALLLLLYIFAPIWTGVALYYIPAFVMMLVAAIIEPWRTRG
jgi:hypothetical protein